MADRRDFGGAGSVWRFSVWHRLGANEFGGGVVWADYLGAVLVGAGGGYAHVWLKFYRCLA